ncbi:putative F-box protein At1g14315 [Bidens hawaiensis]|uniref:putative F-box protein At1g14315 n=1 Tax=Bidens hawaiensis TaxID=980011 RepID=UPI004049E59E
MDDVLPPNLMSDIFSRLPVKSIIYCKCVCKNWRDLVSEPYFVHLHLSRSRKALIINEFENQEIFKRRQPGSLTWLEIEHEHKHKITHRVKSLNLNRCARLQGCHIVQLGSVNGLVSCWCSHDFICIFNPVLEEYITIPKPTFNRMPSFYFLWFWCFKSRRIQNGTGLLGPRVGVFLNGHVYFLLGKEIYDFDLNTETFELFASPPAVEGQGKESKHMLGILKGRLSRVSWCSSRLEVWIMKDESWYKENVVVRYNLAFLGWRPMCLMDDLNCASFFMLKDRANIRLMAYCLDTNTVKHLELRGYLGRLMTYRPSFVKLDNFGSGRVHKVYDKMG